MLGPELGEPSRHAGEPALPWNTKGFLYRASKNPFRQAWLGNNEGLDLTLRKPGRALSQRHLTLLARRGLGEIGGAHLSQELIDLVGLVLVGFLKF